VLSQAFSIALADDGTLYIADTDNRCIRAVTTDGTIVPVVDGLSRPEHIRWADGALWVADAGDNQILRVDPASGEMTVIAGSGEPAYTGDGGPATAAALNDPWGVTVVDGEVWIADSGNAAIRRVGTDGIIETVAGGTQGYADGPAEDAAFCLPTDVVAGDGGMYVADYCNGVVRRLE
jgi:streptogramin lyase